MGEGFFLGGGGELSGHACVLAARLRRRWGVVRSGAPRVVPPLRRSLSLFPRRHASLAPRRLQ